MNKYGEVFSNLNLCTRCGACCTTWKVCFPAVEADARKAAGVPIELAVPVNESLLAMKGTKLRRKRCCALKGQIGHWVSCAIYLSRPTACSDFKASWEMGVSNQDCDRARTIYGLVATWQPNAVWRHVARFHSLLNGFYKLLAKPSNNRPKMIMVELAALSF